MSVVFLLLLVILWLIFTYEVKFDWSDEGELIMWYTHGRERHYKILTKHNEH